MASGLWRGGAGAEDALRVRDGRRLLGGVEQREPDLVVRRWAAGVVPAHHRHRHLSCNQPGTRLVPWLLVDSVKSNT